MIKDLLVHLDHTPASPGRLEAALALAAACGAQVTALYLLAEPFLRGVAGLHAPTEVIREHWPMPRPKPKRRSPPHAGSPGGAICPSPGAARVARSIACRRCSRARRAPPIW